MVEVAVLVAIIIVAIVRFDTFERVRVVILLISLNSGRLAKQLLAALITSCAFQVFARIHRVSH